MRGSSSSARSETTRSAPCSRSASAWPTRSTPTTKPNRPGSPRLDPCERVLEHRRLAPAAPRARLQRRGTCPAPACPSDASRAATIPSTRHLEQILDPGRLQHLAALALDGDDRPVQPVSRTARRSGPSPRRPSTPARWISASTSSFLRLPEPVRSSRSRADRSGHPRAARSHVRRGTSERRRSAACRLRTRRSPPPRRTGRRLTRPFGRARRKSSNISFHASACTVAVCVSTPSRSNRHASISLGSPSIEPLVRSRRDDWLRPSRSARRGRIDAEQRSSTGAIIAAKTAARGLCQSLPDRPTHIDDLQGQSSMPLRTPPMGPDSGRFRWIWAPLPACAHSDSRVRHRQEVA